MIIFLFFKLNKKIQKSDSIFFLDTSEIWTRVIRVTVTRTTVPTTHSIKERRFEYLVNPTSYITFILKV